MIPPNWLSTDHLMDPLLGQAAALPHLVLRSRRPNDESPD